jgi:hypothetical protein
MFIADTLSRAYPMPGAQVNLLTEEEDDVSHDYHNVCQATWARIEQATNKDDQLQVVSSYIMKGWPERRASCDAAAQPFFNERHRLAVQHKCLFRGEQVVMPRALRSEMLVTTHRTHMGVEACLKRMREVMYWPGMAAEVKQHVLTCDTCTKHQRAPAREPLEQHEVPDMPWVKVAVDLCQFNNRTLLVMVDYHSNYIEVDSLTSTRQLTSSGVCKLSSPDGALQLMS